MGNEMMDLPELASYLQRDQREVAKLASRGYLPGHKVGGEWRFARAEINHWIETQMHAYTEEELAALEASSRRNDSPELIIADLLPQSCVAVPLRASTRTSVLKELVNLAEQSWQVYDPEAVLDAIKLREDLGPTTLSNGVAIPHPRRPLPNALGESLIAFGRTASGIPFGKDGGLTDVFFLVCCRDDRTHLQALARLSRLLLRPDFLDNLRAAGDPAESWEIITAAERDLVADE